MQKEDDTLVKRTFRGMIVDHKEHYVAVICYTEP